MKFSVIISLMCEQRGGLVNRVSAQSWLDLFARAEQEVGDEVRI